MTDLICLVGTRAIAHEYDRALLSPEDARRLAQSPVGSTDEFSAVCGSMIFRRFS